MRKPRIVLTLLIGVPFSKSPKTSDRMSKKRAIIKSPSEEQFLKTVKNQVEKGKGRRLSGMSKKSLKSVKSIKTLSYKLEESNVMRPSSIWRSKISHITDQNIYWPLTDEKQLFNINYMIFKGEKVFLQVIICGQYAKIINKGKAKAVKMIQDQGNAWIAFTMLHQCISELTPQTLLKHEIEIEIKPGLEVSREPEFFYKFSYHQSDEKFPTLVKMINSDTVPVRPEKELAWEDGTTVKIVAPVAALHRPQVLKTIEKNSYDAISSRPYIKTALKKSRTYDSFTSRKSTLKADEEEVDYPKLVIKGDEIIYEKPVWTSEQHNPRPEIHHVAAYITSSDTISPQNRMQMRPFSIYIRSLYKLPRKVLQELRVQKIMVQYSYPPVCDTIQIGPVDVITWNKVKVNSLKTFFYPNEKDDTLIIEALQLRQLVIKIYGLREAVIVKERGSVFGEGLYDDIFSIRTYKKVDNNLYEKMLVESKIESAQKRPVTSEIIGGNEMIPLCFAKIGMDELIDYTTYIMKKTVPLQATLENSSHERFKRSLKPIILARIHENCNITENGALSEKDLIEAESLIKVEIKTGCSYKKSFLSKTLSRLPAFSRFFIIYRDTTLAYVQLKKLFQYNSLASLPNSNGLPNSIFQNLTLDEMLGTKKFLLEKLVLRERMRNSTRSSDEQAEEYLNVVNPQYYVTGFLVDCINFCILMIEAPVGNTVPIIMTDNFELKTSSGRLLYNSDLIFNERLYNEFIMFGGLYLSVLGIPLQSILKSNWLTMKNMIPDPAVKCVEALEKVLQSKRISDDLFPTPQELLSCDFEFGVPIRKTNKNIHISPSTELTSGFIE